MIDYNKALIRARRSEQTLLKEFSPTDSYITKSAYKLGVCNLLALIYTIPIIQVYNDYNNLQLGQTN